MVCVNPHRAILAVNKTSETVFAPDDRFVGFAAVTRSRVPLPTI